MKTLKERPSKTFLPKVGHDIKSLNNAISDVAQSLSVRRFNIQDQHLIRAGMQMTHSDSSTSLTHDLATREKHRSAIINPHAVYNLRQHFERLLDNFHFEALDKKIDLSLAFEEDISVAYWDILSLRIHVLNNVLSDAIFNTPFGGKVSIRIGKSDGYKISIKISDSGTCIPAAKRESLFCRHMTSNSNEHGDALYHARCCIQAHKGAISIVDEPGFSATTFKIELPLYTLCIR